jgi:hypothetical protein
VALTKLGALAAETVLARRGDQRNDAAALVEPFELGQIAARRRSRPSLDLGERAGGPAIGQGIGLAGLPHPVQAEIARTPLQQRDADRHLKSGTQARQVAQEELVLQVLGRGADESTGAAQQHRHQIGVGLADAGSSFDDQSGARLDRFGDGSRHAQLLVAFDVVRVGLSERAVRAECVGTASGSVVIAG